MASQIIYTWWFPILLVPYFKTCLFLSILTMLTAQALGSACSNTPEKRQGSSSLNSAVKPVTISTKAVAKFPALRTTRCKVILKAEFKTRYPILSRAFVQLVPGMAAASASTRLPRLPPCCPAWPHSALNYGLPYPLQTHPLRPSATHHQSYS